MEIGIGVTTHNRKKYCDVTLNAINRYLPPNSKVVVVDDGSIPAYPGATFRFVRPHGAPTAKNKCLELLDDCDHIFLFDDDCYPKKDKWWEPYINSPEPHLNYIFKYKKEIKDNLAIASNPNGCMMYIHKSCLETVGGFDPGFEYYGYWHASYSIRCFNAGLTTSPFMDVHPSKGLFKSLDEAKSIAPSTSGREKYIVQNRNRYFQKIDSKEYIDYKSPGQAPSQNIRIWYLTPFSLDCKIGKEYNEQISLLPDTDWICIRDGDTCFTTPESKWGIQIHDIIKSNPNYDLIGCMTNRVANPFQCYNGEPDDESDWNVHKERGRKLYEERYVDVEETKKDIAGLFLLFSKYVWEKNKFRETPPYRTFDTRFCEDIFKNNGKIGIAKGLYLFHDYRFGKEDPKRYTKHLL